MKEIQISKYPNRKKTAIVVYDSETNTGYVVGYFNKEENIPLFLEALCNKIYVKDNDNNEPRATN